MYWIWKKDISLNIGRILRHFKIKTNKLYMLEQGDQYRSDQVQEQEDQYKSDQVLEQEDQFSSHTC